MLFKFLVCFLAVCEEKSFSKAGQRLYISAPAVSKQIDALEAGLGFTLFERTHRGVQLSPAGEAFYQTVKHLTEDFDTSVRSMQKQYSQKGHIRLGVRGPDAYTMVPAFLSLMTEELPQYTVSTLLIRPVDTIDLLLHDKVDLSFTYGYDPQKHLDSPVGYVEILQDTPVCYVPPSVPELTSRKELTLKDLVPYTLLIVEKGSSDFHDQLYQEIEEQNLPIHLIPVVEGDISVAIYSGSQPTIAIGTALHNSGCYSGAIIPFRFHAAKLPVGMLCRKEEVSFYRKNVATHLREKFLDILSQQTKNQAGA